MNEAMKIAAGFAAGAVVGGGTAYLVTTALLKKKYEAYADEQIESVKQHYRVIRKEFPTPKEAVEALSAGSDLDEAVEKGREMVEALGYAEGDDVTVTVEENDEELPAFTVDGKHPDTLVNIFESSQPTAEELEPGALHGVRDPEKPYVLKIDEWAMHDPTIEKITLTYYEEDDTLSDEQDMPIPNPDEIVGEANLHRFGQGSQDPNVVYVRNERLETDFEIIRNQGSFAQMVAGFHLDSEIIKEPRSGVKRMRDNE